MNIETLPFRLPDYGVTLQWNWFNATSYADDIEVVPNPNEVLICFTFEKPVRRPGESAYYTTDIVRYLIPKGYCIYNGQSFNMN